MQLYYDVVTCICLHSDSLCVVGDGISVLGTTTFNNNVSVSKTIPADLVVPLHLEKR